MSFKLENFAQATAAYIENILPIFIPVRNVRKAKIIDFFNKNGMLKIETFFGSVQVKRVLLTQQHKRILENLLAEPKQRLNDGSFYIEIERYNFLKKIGATPTNYNWLEEKITDLRSATIELSWTDQEDNKQTFGFGIIEEYKYTEEVKEGKGGRGRPIKKMKIKFTRAYTMLYRNYDLLNYRSMLPLLNRLRNPFLEGLITYLFLHKKQDIYFSTFVKNSGLDSILEERMINDHKNSLGELETIKSLEPFGILIDNKDPNDPLIMYKRPDGVYFLEQNQNLQPKNLQIKPKKILEQGQLL